MAKGQSILSDRGVTHPAGYFVPVINLNRISREAKVVFLGFADQAARNTNQSPVMAKTYQVSGADFDRYFSTTTLNILNANVYDRAYALADATYDGAINTGYTLESDGTYTRDSDSATVDISEAVETFFENATDV